LPAEADPSYARTVTPSTLAELRDAIVRGD
jgi:hypothetical protein